MHFFFIRQNEIVKWCIKVQAVSTLGIPYQQQINTTLLTHLQELLVDHNWSSHEPTGHTGIKAPTECTIQCSRHLTHIKYYKLLKILTAIMANWVCQLFPARVGINGHQCSYGTEYEVKYAAAIIRQIPLELHISYQHEKKCQSYYHSSLKMPKNLRTFQKLLRKQYCEFHECLSGKENVHRRKQK
jgi:hypothetical protein